MTQVSIASGLIYPTFQGIWTVANGATLDAAGERFGMMGHCYIAGRAASKTISAAGGGSISFRTGAVTFAAAAGGSTFDIGIQDLEVTTGNPTRPDDSFDVKRTLTSATDTITTVAWNTVSMTGGTGTKTIAHGDLIAVVFHMVTRTAPDSVIIVALDPAAVSGTSSGGNRPICAVNTGSWASTNQMPLCLITFDDGTLGIIDNCFPFNSSASEAFSDSTNPDERGTIFQVPWDCKIDGFWMSSGPDNATTSDIILALYATPLGTPAVVSGTSLTIPAESLGILSTYRHGFFALPAEVSLSKTTDYCLAVKATGAGGFSLRTGILASTNYRAFFQNGTNTRKGTRNNQTAAGGGAFAEESPAITMYQMGVRISSFDDGTGTGGGGGGGVSRSRVQLGH